MPESKLERDMPIIQEHWNKFISRIKQELKNLYDQQRKLVADIKRAERVEKILKRGREDIDFLLLHKESILELDNTLYQKFIILNAFKKRNNLDNAVAIRTFNEILNSKKLVEITSELESLKEKKSIIDEEIDKVVDLTYGTAFDKETIIKYSKKFELSGENLTTIMLYPVIKSAKKIVQSISKKPDLPKEKPSVNTEEAAPLVEETTVSNEETLEPVEEAPSYEKEFEKVKERYETIKNKINILLDKYYTVLQNMSPIENQYYKKYCLIKEEDLKKQKFEGEYDEALSKIVAMKLFEIKAEIERMIQSIQISNYSNKDDIDFCKECITDFESYANQLQELDKKITDGRKEIETLDEQKVFFLTDRAMQPFIPSVIREKGYQGSLVNIIQKAQEGHIQKKKGSNIMPLKVSKKFKDEVGRTVFAVRNYKIIVSYIKTNDGTGLNDGGIMILTASLLNPNTIQEDTDKVIRENRDQIIRQLAAIEKKDPQQIALQAIVKEELTRGITSEETLEEVESNGRKSK